MIIGTAHAQKANLGSKVCGVQKVRLPMNYTDPGARTYSIITQGRFAYDIDPEGGKLYGWEVDRVSPNVKAVISLYGFQINSPKRKSKKVEKKDKEGNVTESYTEYWYTSSATGKGTLYLYGHSDEFVYQRPSKAKKKKEPNKPTKRELAAEKEQKELEANPFLTDDVLDDLADSDMDEDAGWENASLPFVKNINVDRTLDVKTSKHRSAPAAYKEYREKQYPKLTNFKINYPTQAFKGAIRTLNGQYGYAPMKNTFRLRTIKNEKHPESKLWNDAVTATTKIFSTIRFNKAIDKTQGQMMPIIDYFTTQVERNSADDKKQRKVKKAALENLMNIYFYLDLHDKNMDVAGQFLETKKLDKISKRMKDRSLQKKAHLEFLQMYAAHYENDLLVLDENEEIEVEADEGEVEGSND